MTEYLFPPMPAPAIPVRGSQALYPVRRVFCVGRNYAAHAREMGSDPSREPPFYFTKAAASILLSGGVMPYPPETANLHHEIELVAAIGAPAFRVAPDKALDAVMGYAVGLDMTRRDLQFAARDKGRPWDLGKSFENAAIIGEIVPAGETGPITQGAIALSVNETLRQNSDISEMTWSVAEIVADLSRFYHLAPGDLIYTGTPEGVGPVVAGDRLKGHVERVGEIEVVIGAAE